MASAGSGKTYQLAKKYISLILSDVGGDSYRHILAVTFTNKATAEMKSRILKELYVLSYNPDKSKYLGDLIKDLGLGKDELQRRAKMYLQNILHDYSSFSISTIDKFFQQTLRAFTREIGCFASYQVELDRDSLLREAVDRILDSISSENAELYEWVMSSMKDKIEKGARFRVDEKMVETARSMSSGKYRNALDETGIDPVEAFSKSNLKQIEEECDSIIKRFASEVYDAAEELNTHLSKPSELKQLDKYLHLFGSDEKIPPINKTLQKAAPGSHFNFLMQERYKIYNTAWKVRNLTYSLGFAREYSEQMDALMKEKNVMSLEDSNSILKRIIGGSDTPFIYEKMGVRYNDFLLDEFQDTSRIQWENLRPLLVESESRGGRNLVVGDVKQSIYRWRDSDWKLLDREVPDAFSGSCTSKPLLDNYRSCAAIVDFNSDFFTYAANRMTEQFGKVEGKGPDSIYSGVKQSAQTDNPQRGQVRVSFCQPSADGSRDVNMVECDKILESINDSLASGASLKDIAVLVRTNDEGGLVANFLKSKGIEVVSDDSLSICSSRIVTLLLATFKRLLDEGDKIASFLLEDCDMTAVETGHTLVDMAEHYLRELRDRFPETFDAEILFINGFMDILQEWSSTYSNNLPAFMEYWETANAIANSPDGTDAVTIMTIHKSKGLEFKHVIFPFADTVGFDPGSGKTYWSWCRPDDDLLGETDKINKAIYPVSFTKEDISDSLFASAYSRELGLAAIDSLNIFYVALTRAVNVLHIISALPSKDCIETLSKGGEYRFKSPMEIMYWYREGKLEESLGEKYDFSRQRKANLENVQDLYPGYPSTPLGNRLAPSTDAAEFFGEDGAVGAEASERLAGIELHTILSRVYELSDLDGYCGHPDYEMLKERVAAHPEWFCASARVFNEATVFTGRDSNLRPDKVIVDRQSVTVVDYKFGKHRSVYESQISGYVDMFKEMGYTDVHGYLWYVYEDSVECVR